MNRFTHLGVNQRGFTIVELLIVIVVIGILAAITIVAYTGITTQANAKSSLGNAQSVKSVVDTYSAENGSYPTLANLTSYTGYARLPGGVSVGGNGTMPASNINVYYIPKSTTGACIGYMPANTSTMLWVYTGNATGSPAPTIGTGSTGSWPTITGGTAATCS